MRPISTRAYHSSVRKKSIARSETVAERRKYSSLPNTPSEDTQNAFVKNDKLYANAPVTNQQQQFKKTVIRRNQILEIYETCLGL